MKKKIWDIITVICLVFLYFDSVKKDSLVPIIAFWLTALPIIAIELTYKTNKEENNNE